jgi:hypothetical protein
MAYGVGLTTLMGKGGGGILVFAFPSSSSFFPLPGCGVALLVSQNSFGVVSFAESGEVAVEPDAS